MTSSFLQTKKRGWGSRWSFVAATTGAAIGLGNVWKFSYLAGENGGSAFLLAYIACVFLVALPVMIAEVVLGCRGRANPVAAIHNVAIEAVASPWWKLIAWLGMLAALLILSYYSVIAGWSLAYIEKLFTGEFDAASVQIAGESFSQFLSSPWQLIKWQSVFLALILLMSMSGARIGIAMMARIALPLLLLSLSALAVYGFKMGDGPAAIEFLFVPDFTQLTANSLLIALGHAFFSLSIGVGAMLVFGSYSPDGRSVSGMLSIVVLLDLLVSLLAGLAIFPLVFALKMAPAMGPGLMFIAMPYGFGNMEYGSYFGALFFLMVSVAAVTSGVALLEPTVNWLSERFGWWRAASAALLVFLVWVLGLLTALSFNVWADVSWQGLSLFQLLDFVTANLLLPIGGLLIAVFVGWKLRREVLRDEFYIEHPYLFLLWYRLLRYISAPAVLLILVSSLYLSFY